MKNLLAQIPIGTFEGVGPLGPTPAAGPPIQATKLFEQALSVTVGVMTVIGAIWFIFGLLSGAVQWVASGGDKQALQNAQKKITSSVIGLFIVVAAYAIIGVIGIIVGLPELLNPSTVILNKLRI